MNQQLHARTLTAQMIKHIGATGYTAYSVKLACLVSPHAGGLRARVAASAVAVYTTRNNTTHGLPQRALPCSRVEAAHIHHEAAQGSAGPNGATGVFLNILTSYRIQVPDKTDSRKS